MYQLHPACRLQQSRAPFVARIAAVPAAQVLLEEQVPVISFYFGIPSPGVLSEVQSSGALTMGTATCLQEAQQLEAAGAPVLPIICTMLPEPCAVQSDSCTVLPEDCSCTAHKVHCAARG